MVREDLVSGAVTFLQDPSVAAAPLEQRLAFLRSKNLTQDEIDISLQRASSEGPVPAQSSRPPPLQDYGYQPQAYQQGYGGYPNGYQNGYWQPPQEPPRRDWRDWFIMATVVSGVGYGAYLLAKRYIIPVIAPPTPPQLEQDKASIDASFDKTFALIEQLAADTEELKNAEKTRSDKLDVALSDVEAIINDMKDASKRRDDEVRRTNDEVRSLRDLIPRAIKAQEETADTRLKELAKEMNSLKTLIANRVNPARPTQSSATFDAPPTNKQPATISSPGLASAAFPSTTAGTTQAPQQQQQLAENGQPLSQTPARSSTASPYGAKSAAGRAKIPAWQMAASRQAEEEVTPNTAASGPAVAATS